ncbi:hypothetical protein [Tsukamurella tyrosinosolvens]|uniref:hypothetical protein n=1 Tax=Tsukamurella tyrosinosolvens TaxID=57704 RepID=UPI000CA3BBC4|nr:hypothetical protein [Tsukamurella tyrosinosolvens]AUN38634.1 hypothetical protein ASU32_00260 [Tsukamurella tyrosinosolvens]
MACPTNFVDHGTPLPLTAARSGYLGALAHRDEYTREQLEWLRRQADEADAILAECLIPPAVPWREQLAREGTLR